MRKVAGGLLCPASTKAFQDTLSLHVDEDLVESSSEIYDFIDIAETKPRYSRTGRKRFSNNLGRNRTAADHPAIDPDGLLQDESLIAALMAQTTSPLEDEVAFRHTFERVPPTLGQWHAATIVIVQRLPAATSSV